MPCICQHVLCPPSHLRAPHRQRAYHRGGREAWPEEEAERNGASVLGAVRLAHNSVTTGHVLTCWDARKGHPTLCRCVSSLSCPMAACPAVCLTFHLPLTPPICPTVLSLEHSPNYRSSLPSLLWSSLARPCSPSSVTSRSVSLPALETACCTCDPENPGGIPTGGPVEGQAETLTLGGTQGSPTVGSWEPAFMTTPGLSPPLPPSGIVRAQSRLSLPELRRGA